MASRIITKKGSGAPLASDLVHGELAVDTVNKRLYTEDAGGTVLELGTAPSTIDINAGTIDGTVIGGSTAAAGSFTTLTASGDVNFDSNTLFVDASANKVGINTASPNADLQVEGSGTSVFRMNDTGDSRMGVVKVRNGDMVIVNGTSVDDSAIDSAGTEKAKILLSDSSFMTFETANNEGMRLTSTGLGIGTSSPSSALHIKNNDAVVIIEDANNGTGGTSYRPTQEFWANGTRVGAIGMEDSFNFEVIADDVNSASIDFFTGGSRAMRIDSSRNVGIGTSSPDALLDVENSTAPKVRVGDGIRHVELRGGSTTQNPAVGTYYAGDLTFATDSTERLRIDSSGNVGIGTTIPNAKIKIQNDNSTVPSLIIRDGGTPSANMLDISSNATGQVMLIDSSGRVLIGTTSTNLAIGNVAGIGLGTREDGIAAVGRAQFSTNGGSAIAVNRIGSDGNLVLFYQAGTQEGTISVSGTTVSYNGGHLSRWSQLQDNSRDESIVKGTVMTNLDQMAVWGDEDNEQLNCMAVSSIEGDPNVAGVFVNWDEDDDFNDMNIAMTGDMVIRIAQGTTVARGDLLMSAGDGTAKPQGDDIVRSKTIAKVTSTHVSHTYADGSYCVPCVLMAC